MADLSISLLETTRANEDSGQNLIRNAGFELTPAFTAATNNSAKWIDGTAVGSTTDYTYGWATQAGGVTSSANAMFDTTTSNSGTASLSLNTLDATGTVSVSHWRTTTPETFHLIPIYSSTAYRFTAWIKTSNVATNAAFVDVRQYSASVSTLSTTASTKFSGANSWTQVVVSFTSNASAAYLGIILRNNVAGNIGSAWFDDLALQRVNPPNTPQAIVAPIITPGIQDVSGPKIWS